MEEAGRRRTGRRKKKEAAGTHFSLNVNWHKLATKL
jgi:hypothetical protein